MNFFFDGKIHCVTDHFSVAFFTMVTMFTCVMSSYLYQQPIAKCQFVTQFAACLVMVSLLVYQWLLNQQI